MTKSIQEWLDKKQPSTCQAMMRVDDNGELVRKAGRRKFYKGKRPIYWAKKYAVRIEMIYRHLKRYGNLKIIQDPNKRKGPGSKALQTHRGKPLTEWAKTLGKSYENIQHHLKRYGHLRFVGKRPNRFTRYRQFHCPKGVFTTIGAMAKANNLSSLQCSNRLKHKKKFPDWFEGEHKS